jgi:hypothetical protein
LPPKDKKARSKYNSEYNKKWYSQNKTKKKEQAKKSRKRAVNRNRKYVENHKLQNPCPCGENEPCCLSYHHYEDNKEGNISDMVNKGYGISKIKAEIDKCIVLCLNCHSKLHKKKKDKMIEELKKQEETKEIENVA